MQRLNHKGIPPVVDTQRCIGCKRCVDNCVSFVLEMNALKAQVARGTWCIACGHCTAVCPVSAITHEIASARPEPPALSSSALTPESLQLLMRARRSIRRYKPEPVSKDLSTTFDPDRIARVLGNLLDNALNYATPGAIDVSARQEGDELRITVRDHGPGLPPGDEARVLERFYRGDPSRTRNDTGSGLGLSIAKAITEGHGGRLEAANHPDGGAEFTVVLPMTTERKRA